MPITVVILYIWSTENFAKRTCFTYKLCLTVYKALHTRSPSYIKELVVLAPCSAATARLRTAARPDAQVTLACPRVRRNYGECGFSFAGPATWNKLSDSTRLAPTLELFRHSSSSNRCSKPNCLNSHIPELALLWRDFNLLVTCLNSLRLCSALELS